MKTVILTCLVMIGAYIPYNAFAQEKKICPPVQVKAEKNSKSRGTGGMFKLDPAKKIALPEELPKTRGKGHPCYLVIDNKTNMDINVFVDSVHVGFIDPMKKGKVQCNKGYSIIHCWSSGGEFKWVQRGDCKECIKVFELNPMK